MAWFYAKHGKQGGPVEVAELRSKLASGEVSPDDLVWREGMADWKPAGEIAELAPGPVEPEGPEPGKQSPPPSGESAPSGAQPAAPGGAVAPATQAQTAPGVPVIHPPPPTSGLAIASMVCGIIGLLTCGFFAIGGIPAVICGHMAMSSINRSTEAMEGRGMAIAGLIMGYLSIVLQILAIIFVVVGFNSVW